MLVTFKGYGGRDIVVNIAYITHIMEDKDDSKYSTIHLVDGESVYVEETVERILSRIVVPTDVEQADTTLFS